MNKYTWEEISQHNTENSLWVVIDKCVYDVTVFHKSHPGGLNVLLNNGGQNVTKKFDSIKGHSINPRIDNILENVCIGILKE